MIGKILATYFLKNAETREFMLEVFTVYNVCLSNDMDLILLINHYLKNSEIADFLPGFIALQSEQLL